MIGIHPSFILIGGSFLIPFMGDRVKRLYVLILSAFAFWTVLNVPHGTYWVYNLLNYKLILGRIDALSKVFSYVFAIILFIGLLFSLRIADDIQLISALCYGGSALGVTLAGDFFSLYIFWEIMAVSSCFLILARRTQKATQAAFRYILVHIIGGLFLLAGILFFFKNKATLEFSHIGLSGMGSILIFIGIALNAALFPLHPWLVDAYPEATEAGSVFLSAFTTKSAVYLMARTFAGTDILIWLGCFMVLIPMLYLVIENDIRRIFAYSLLTQVGIMMCGIGIGTPLAINGAVAHAFSHVIYKALLFMCAGSVLFMTGKSKCSDLGNLYKYMPFTCAFCIIGACSISAVPFFNGFVSKSMVISSAAHENFILLWFVLQFACACVIHGIKAPYFMFFGNNKRNYSGVKEVPLNMLIAMGIAAFLCLSIGIYPQPLLKILPYHINYNPYSLSHVLSQFQILLFGTLGLYILMKTGFYPYDKPSINLELDWFYRRGAALLFRFFDKSLNGLNEICEKIVLRSVSKLAAIINDLPISIIMFVMISFWLITGVREKSLEIKKSRLYNRLRYGVLPVGLGACFSIFFVVLLFMLCKPW